MKRILILLVPLLALAGLAGCADVSDSGRWQSQALSMSGPMVFGDKDLHDLADMTAMKLAERYPAGRTLLAMEYNEEDAFGVAFEGSLRTQGFQFATAQPMYAAPAIRPLQVAYIFDAIAASPHGYYLYVRTSDGYSFSQVYTLIEGRGFVPRGVVAQTEPFFEVHEDGAQPTETGESRKWHIKPGGLKEQLEVWADQAGYQLVWDMDTDYQMQAGAVFNDSFTGAVKRLFSRMFTSGNSLRVRIYQANKVIEVGEG